MDLYYIFHWRWANSQGIVVRHRSVPDVLKADSGVVEIFRQSFSLSQMISTRAFIMLISLIQSVCFLSVLLLRCCSMMNASKHSVCHVSSLHQFGHCFIVLVHFSKIHEFQCRVCVMKLNPFSVQRVYNVHHLYSETEFSFFMSYAICLMVVIEYNPGNVAIEWVRCASKVASTCLPPLLYYLYFVSSVRLNIVSSSGSTTEQALCRKIYAALNVIWICL